MKDKRMFFFENMEVLEFSTYYMKKPEHDDRSRVLVL